MYETFEPFLDAGLGGLAIILLIRLERRVLRLELGINGKKDRT